MLKKFIIKNYKNFKDELIIDFEDIAGYQFSTDCITEGVISKMLIYGRNATGKTNLGKALLDIRTTMFASLRFINEAVFLNADSMDETAMFSYEFRFDDKVLIYRYTRFSNQELKNEQLIIEGETVYFCDYESKEFDFHNLKYIDAETANIDRYLQLTDVEDEAEEIEEPKLPFIRWLINNVAFSNDSLLIKFSNYVRRMVMITAGNSIMFRSRRINDNFYESMKDPARLKDLETFLNAMGIECKLLLKMLPDGRGELYFAHEKVVPFYETASSGTLALVDLYRRLIPRDWDASFIYLDEFDAFYHYEMTKNVMSFLKKRYPKCQIIMTSHNTNLMTNRLMRPDCLFVLSRVGTLTALCNATLRELREGHNLEKMYISGEFAGYE